MERKYDLSLRGFINAINGRPYYGEELSVNPEHIFQHLRELQGKSMAGKMKNYPWIPKDKDTLILTPEQAAEFLKKKIANNPGKGAIEFEIDHFVYYDRRGEEKHILELYKAYRDVKTNQNVRLRGKVMKLEFLVHPRSDSGHFLP